MIVFSDDNIVLKTDNENMTFEDGYAKINFYNTFSDRISSLITSEYYPIGELEQEGCKENLKASINILINDVAKKLVEQHQNESQNICNTFEELAEKALATPQTSEELMQLGVYMTWANTELMTQLTERLQRSLEIIVRLMDVTVITQEHIDVNSSAVLWLARIKPILEQNSSMYEQCKFDFEERLQRAVEQINKDIVAIEPYLVTLNKMDEADNVKEYMFHISKFLVKVRRCEEQKAWINKQEATFKFPLSAFKGLEELKLYIYPFFRLIKVCRNWQRSYHAWMDGPFEFLDAELAAQQMEDYLKELMKTQKTYRNKLKQLAAENNPRRFAGSVDDPDPFNLPAPIKLCQKTIQQIKDFRPILTLMEIMCNSALLQRHWDEMSILAGFDLTPNAGTSLRKIVNMNLQNVDSYEIISSGAVKEQQLLNNLVKMQSEWDDVKFKVMRYKETTIDILTQLDDVQAVLDDHIVKTLSMRGSVFVKPYESQVKAWYDKIVRINSTIDVWGKVQSQWLYLLPIFSSKDIVSQMPNEGVLFREVDGTYRRYMSVVAKDSRVIETAGSVGLLESMWNCCELLDKINDGVTSYLEKKRLYFPRFFFLSNDEMLEILSETKDPLRVQPHLRKCFEAIEKLDFDQKLQIHAMFSQEKERIDFTRIVNTEEVGGSVEKWYVMCSQTHFSISVPILVHYYLLLISNSLLA